MINGLKEVVKFKDLLLLFVYRDVVSIYKQTILGPIWFVAQPILTSIVQYVVFGGIAGISSGEIPYFLFVLAGNTIWSFFSTTMLEVAETFRKNQDVFGKVYFPRIIIPFSVAISACLKFLIQFILFVIISLKYSLNSGAILINMNALLLPLLMIALILISLGLGLLITSVTTKYRDFAHLLKFGMTLFMYLTPIVYPTSLLTDKLPEKFEWIAYLNPLTGILEAFKHGFLAQKDFEWYAFLWSIVFGIIVFTLGSIVFNKTSKKVMDII